MYANPLRVVVAGGDACSTSEISAALNDEPIDLLEAPREAELEDLMKCAVDGRLHGTLDGLICDGRRNPRRALMMAVRMLELDATLPVLVLVARTDTSTALLARVAGVATLRSPFADFELRTALLALD